MSRAVKKLITDGLVEKRDNPDNLKIKHLRATEKGRAIYQVIKRENDYSEAVALQGFSDAEVQQLNAMLTRMRENVAADWNAVKKGQHRNY
mgnify:FL=1